jgi:hypothetical protein
MEQAMKLAITSDLHLGDPECVMVDVDPESPTGWRLGSFYEKFRDAVGTGNRYLILIGDIFDLSIANYTQAYSAAKTFFRALNRDELADEIIYLAGNHDFSIYRTFVHQRNVINRIRNKKLPTTFWTVPGVLDDTPNAARDPVTGVRMRGKLVLPDVHPNPPPGPRYAGLFLDDLSALEADPTTGQPAKKGLPVNFAYPNLYFVESDGTAWLITHGHYLEDYWCLGSRVAGRMAYDDLGLQPDGCNMTLEDLVGFNVPLSELNSASLGQAGKLSDVFRDLQQETRDGDTRRMSRYMRRGIAWLEESLPWYALPARIPMHLALEAARHIVTSMVRDRPDARYDPKFLLRPPTNDYFESFYCATLQELDRLQPHPLLQHRRLALAQGQPRGQPGRRRDLQIRNEDGIHIDPAVSRQQSLEREPVIRPR